MNRFMMRALELARRGEGRVSPNPLVGCVIAKNGAIVGEGYHAKFGGDHAEVAALKRAGAKAKGADLHVSLEPCCHQGKTPPCTKAIIRAGIKRVFAAMEDPNPLVAGKGVKELREAGVEVRVGEGEKEARALNESFVKFVSAGKPFVLVKFASDSGGRLPSEHVTGREADALVHRLRNKYDAILVGVNTVLSDDPLLSCRMKGGRDPLRVVLDSRLRIPLQARVLRDGNAAIATTARCDKRRRKAIEAKGVRVLVLPSRGGRVDLNALLERLAAMNVASVMVEGGAEVIESFLRDGLVDRVMAFVVPRASGGGKRLCLPQFSFRDVRVSRIGRDSLVEAVT